MNDGMIYTLVLAKVMTQALGMLFFGLTLVVFLGLSLIIMIKIRNRQRRVRWSR